MSTHTYSHKSKFSVGVESLFELHERPGAFERLCPPWLEVEVLEREGGISDGARVMVEVAAGPVRVPWLLEHGGYMRGREFSDHQVAGPFSSWKHTHRFSPGEAGSSLEDKIVYELPPWLIQENLISFFINKDLKRMFDYREEVIKQTTSLGDVTPMSVLVSGASGLIGSALVPHLTFRGHAVRRLTRSPRTEGDIGWTKDYEVELSSAIEGIDAVVHLAGENIADGRWDDSKKDRIRASRSVGTRRLCEALARMHRPPQVLVSASATGLYGDRGQEVMTEASAPGGSFLARVCAEWEEATQPARAAGIRVVNLRIGVVLTPRGGALQRMLLPFQLGAGGVIGSGRQFMSWIAIDDLLGAIDWALTNENLNGPVNAVAPCPVTNSEFTQTLAKVLFRPAICPVPALAVRLAFGEMANELLLSSCRVRPEKLIQSGYKFRHPQLEGALRHVLGR